MAGHVEDAKSSPTKEISEQAKRPERLQGRRESRELVTTGTLQELWSMANGPRQTAVSFQRHRLKISAY
ncbi:hypothetical protein ColLi_00713 [Colletotrichum liriopes]|uniref:Uncharacterized protein n=1 Tax=Colletotrichum liriopes TaxID=708192 RepID=A0AA37LMB9_9PEZI|nr:hypothetical protein ColLi_00713 [Colletotrichum liriopes]